MLLAHFTVNEFSWVSGLLLIALGVGIGMGVSLAFRWLARRKK